MARGTTTASTLGPFEYRFEPAPSFIRLARHALAGWLQAQPAVHGDGIDDLLVACSELCTNAVEHASGNEGSVSLRGYARGDAVVLEVEDDGPGFDWPFDHTMRDVGMYDDHGRGLFIVESLTDALEVERVDEHTRVRCCKDGMLRVPGEPPYLDWSQRIESFGG